MAARAPARVKAAVAMVNAVANVAANAVNAMAKAVKVNVANAASVVSATAKAAKVVATSVKTACRPAQKPSTTKLLAPMPNVMTTTHATKAAVVVANVVSVRIVRHAKPKLPPLSQA